MRIQVDARMLRAGGIGRYLREITGPWLSAEGVDRIRFLGRPEELEPWLEEVDGRGVAEIVPWDAGPYSPRAQIGWPFVQARASGPGGWKPEVSFFPHFDVPLLSHPSPSVVTVHDLIHFRFPGGFPFWKRWAGRILLQGALSNASRVVTVSQHSRVDILRLNPGLADRVEVVPNGVSTVFRPLAPEEEKPALDRWGHLVPFVLILGEWKRHKNLSLAVETVRRVRGTHPDLRLVVVGPGPGTRGSPSPTPYPGGTHDWIVPVEALRDDDLRELYALSRAFLFPSLYEGFGLPPLEAYACGARVLASRRTALPEVLEGKAELLDPDDKGAWVEALSGAVEAPRGRWNREETGPAGRSGPEVRIRPSVPSWADASRRTLELLELLAREG